MKIPSVHIYGPIGIHPFGVLVATGILVGTWVALRRARQTGIEAEAIRAGVLWSVVAGFIGAHLVHAFFYAPVRLSVEGPIYLLKLWDGISSFGGFIGGFIGLLGYLVWRRKGMLREVDIILEAFVVGWIFGRAGCTLAFDHPGLVTDFFLGMPYPEDGLVRHNLGFYEFLYTLGVLFPAQLILRRLQAPPGSHVTSVFLLYCPARFGFDFLRLPDLSGGDRRYWGLTPAQYGCIAIFVIGIAMVFLVRWNARRLQRAAEAELPDGVVNTAIETADEAE
ncbi:MAG: prolipoprotein diacylglyceryl transferase [Bradymonadales bacterium]|nr:prolipoprotein diacylglyceryl transferase [Bradymonadales bacterium]